MKAIIRMSDGRGRARDIARELIRPRYCITSRRYEAEARVAGRFQRVVRWPSSNVWYPVEHLAAEAREEVTS